MNKIFQALTFFSFFFLGLSCLDFGPQKALKTQEVARIKTTRGDIVLAFKPEIAPATVARVKKLIEEGFYTGLRFHRVVKDFIIQTGDPTGTGNGGSGLTLKPEFSSEKHIKGTVSMARSSDINSADSQFFITLGEYPHLDGKYTIFAQVTEGLEVAEKIVAGDKILSLTIETNPLN